MFFGPGAPGPLCVCNDATTCMLSNTLTTHVDNAPDDEQKRQHNNNGPGTSAADFPEGFFWQGAEAVQCPSGQSIDLIATCMSVEILDAERQLLLPAPIQSMRARAVSIHQCSGCRSACLGLSSSLTAPSSFSELLAEELDCVSEERDDGPEPSVVGSSCSESD